MVHSLAEDLGLPTTGTDEEIAQALCAAVKRATNEDSPQSSLQSLYRAISQHGAAHLLVRSGDPLDVVPLLLGENCQAAGDILALVGECGNAKEIVIATQEAVELIRTIASLDTADDDVNLSGQLIRLIGLYSSAIPRLKIHKKTPSQTIRMSLSDLEFAIQHIGPQSTQTEGREIISHVSHLIQQTVSWINSIVGLPSEEISLCKDILRSLLDRSLLACANSINSSLAQRTFQDCFPGLTIRQVPASWEDGARVASMAVDAYTSLGFTTEVALIQPSVGSLVYLAHGPEPLPSTQRLLTGMLGILLTYIRTNVVLDECISILLKTLSAASEEQPKPELSLETIIPFFALLPSLACLHPDPDLRLHVFRIMSLILSLTPGPLRLQILFDLASDPEVPQMCVAALALVREAVLEALSQDGQNVFASRLFLQTFGPVLFSQKPLDFLSSRYSIEDLRGSHELPRLVECLSLYYILVARDERNRTGGRDPETIKTVEKSLLDPLRSFLAEIIDTEHDNSQAAILIASLQISMERVEAILNKVTS